MDKISYFEIAFSDKDIFVGFTSEIYPFGCLVKSQILQDFRQQIGTLLTGLVTGSFICYFVMAAHLLKVNEGQTGNKILILFI